MIHEKVIKLAENIDELKFDKIKKSTYYYVFKKITIRYKINESEEIEDKLDLLLNLKPKTLNQEEIDLLKPLVLAKINNYVEPEVVENAEEEPSWDFIDFPEKEE